MGYGRKITRFSELVNKMSATLLDAADRKELALIVIKSHGSIPQALRHFENRRCRMFAETLAEADGEERLSWDPPVEQHTIEILSGVIEAIEEYAASDVEGHVNRE